MAIKPWIEEQMQVLLDEQSEQDLLRYLVKTARFLEFDYCAFGLRVPYPLMNPTTLLMNNYSAAWQERYSDNNYLAVDPVVLHCLRSTTPLVWSGESSALPFWDDAGAHGIRYGWSQSSFDMQKSIGVLTLSRSSDVISSAEYKKKQLLFSWLNQVVYASFCRLSTTTELVAGKNPLTKREIEILRWTADGKAVYEIAALLNITERTVGFHIENVLKKLGVVNKTAATVQAVVLGLI